jgi:hypothetical protein
MSELTVMPGVQELSFAWVKMKPILELQADQKLEKVLTVFKHGNQEDLQKAVAELVSIHDLINDFKTKVVNAESEERGLDDDDDSAG